MSRHHVNEIIRHARSFAKTDHVQSLLEAYDFKLNVKDFERFLFEDSKILYCLPDNISFSELWEELLAAHKMQQHVQKRWEAFRSPKQAHFDGLLDSLKNVIKRGVKRVLPEEEDENSPFNSEKIKEYNSNYLLLHDPENNLPETPAGAFFSVFAVSFNDPSPANQRKLAREALVRSVKGEATVEDYHIFNIMNSEILRKQYQVSLEPTNFINPSSVIDILQKLIFKENAIDFPPNEEVVDLTIQEQYKIYFNEMTEEKVGHMNFLFRQVSDTDHENYVFDGEDVQDFLSNKYNLDQRAKQQKMELEDYLGKINNNSAEFKKYVAKQYDMLKRILKGQGTKEDYESLSAYLNISKPLQMIYALVLPKTEMAFNVARRKLVERDARQPLERDNAINKNSLDKLVSERERLESQIRNAEQERKDNRLVNIGYSGMMPEFISEVSKFIRTITPVSSDTAFRPAETVISFYEYQQKLLNITTEENTKKRNNIICSIFNDILHLRSILIMPNVRNKLTDVNPLVDIYKIFLDNIDMEYKVDLEGGSVDANDLIGSIYLNLEKIAKEPFSSTNKSLENIDESVNKYIAALNVDIDLSGFKDMYTSPSRVIQNVYLDVDEIVDTLKKTIKTFEFDKSIPRETLFNGLRKTFQVYKVDEGKLNGLKYNKHSIIELVVGLLNYEKNEIYPAIPNIEQYQRIATVENEIYTLFISQRRGTIGIPETTSSLTAILFNKVNDLLNVLWALVMKNIVLFSARFRHVFNFFNACITFEKYDAVQTYADIYDRYLLEYPETAEYRIEDENELKVMKGFLITVVHNYERYRNPKRASQILSWLNQYVEETIEKLQKAQALISQPATVQKQPITGKTLERIHVIFPTDDELAKIGTLIKIEDPFNMSLVDAIEKFKSEFITQSVDNPHFYNLQLAKMLVYLNDLVVDDPIATLQKIISTFKLDYVDIAQPLIVDVNNDEQIFRAINQNSYLLNQQQQSVLVAFIIVLLYTKYHFKNIDMRYKSSDHSEPPKVDYSLTDSIIAPCGSTAEFMIAWKTLLNNISYIKNSLYKDKNQYQINHGIMKYVKDLAFSLQNSTEYYRSDNNNNNITDETLKLELDVVKDYFDKNHNPSNQLEMITKVEIVAVNMVVFFRQHELYFDNANKPTSSPLQIDTKFNISESEYQLYNYISNGGVAVDDNFYVMQAAIAEFQRMYTGAVNGEIASYLQYLIELIDLLPTPTLAPLTMLRLQDALRRTSIPPVVKESSSEKVEKLLTLFRGKMMDTYKIKFESSYGTLPLYHVIINMVVNRMKIYFIEHGELAEKAYRKYSITYDISGTSSFNIYTSDLKKVLDRLYAVQTYLVETYGKEQMFPIICRYALYIKAMVTLIIDQPAMRVTEELVNVSKNWEFLERMIGELPDEITYQFINDTITESINKDTEREAYTVSLYSYFIYVITTKMERFVESHFTLPHQEIHFGAKFAPLIDIFDALQRIELIDLWLIMIHYTQCIALGRGIVSLKYDLLENHGISFSVPDQIVAIPDDYDVVSFVQLLTFNKTNHAKSMLMLLSALSSVLGKYPKRNLHEYKNALTQISFFVNQKEPSTLHWMVTDVFLTPYETLPPERVVSFLCECIYLLTNISSTAFTAFYGKEKESLFLGLSAY